MIEQKVEQGFASPLMSEEKKHEARSKGGKRGHELGRAHEWTSAEASAAGAKSRRRSKYALQEAKR